jgi:hypothetical protein
MTPTDTETYLDLVRRQRRDQDRGCCSSCGLQAVPPKHRRTGRPRRHLSVASCNRDQCLPGEGVSTSLPNSSCESKRHASAARAGGARPPGGIGRRTGQVLRRRLDVTTPPAAISGFWDGEPSRPPSAQAKPSRPPPGRERPYPSLWGDQWRPRRRPAPRRGSAAAGMAVGRTRPLAFPLCSRGPSLRAGWSLTNENGPGARFRSSRGRLVSQWRVEDSNLCSFRDGFTVRCRHRP